MNIIVERFGLAALGLLLSVLTAPVEAFASSIKVVAIGASNTLGWGVGSQKAYPAQLQALLRAKGYDVDVRNAGVNFDTTGGMLARLDAEVPAGTQVVVIQPGGNDRRFLVSKERRAANIDAMGEKLKARNVKVIVYDPVFEPKYYQWDAIHINVEGHTMIAHSLLPQVIAAVAPARRKPPRS
jgi:acyl-CoA thioesterase I